MAEALTFIDRLSTAIVEYQANDTERKFIVRSLVDTIAVAAAGFPEEGTPLAQKCFAGTAVADWSGKGCESIDSVILVNAAAAHALDFDDVFAGTSIHPSAILFPTLLSDGALRDPHLIVSAYGAGMIAARAIGRRLGRGFRHRGWHGTGTVGIMAAVAAAGRARRLDAARLRSAFALAAAQAGGLQVNFGTMAKPCHAGFAAAGGYRAARMAEAGIDGAPDVFGPKGFIDLYGAGDGDPNPDDGYFEPRLERLALKLFPCCYAAHRLIGIALQARESLGGERLADPAVKFRVTVPAGSMRALRYDRPETGLQAKFSAQHAMAAAIVDGAPGSTISPTKLPIARDLRAVGSRVAIIEDDRGDTGELTAGAVHLAVENGSGTLATFERQNIPGSLEEPPAPDELRRKVDDCLSAYRQHAGSDFPVRWVREIFPESREWLSA